MSTFSLDVNSNAGDIIGGLNYALANLGTITNAAGANVLVANTTTGEITTTSSNSGGYTTTTIVSYLYQYMDVKYANSQTGGSGFTSNSAMANYYGLRNTANTTISSNPTDYVWFQATGGFGTTKGLYYQTIGGRQIAFFVGNAAPDPSFLPVPDMPNANSTPLNLDTITSAQNNQIVNVNAYYQGNTTPATPSGGTYNFQTFTLTAPAGWSANIPGFVANTDIYISQAAFAGNTNQTAAPPATLWTVPAVYTSQFQGNTGPAGSRGFVPMGYVITSSDPTTYSNANLTTAFSSSRSNPSPPIGLGFAPIANDTAQFAYTNLFTNNTTTLVKQYDGTGWTEVVGNVISGGLFVPGSINANTLNANQVYGLTIASTGANVGNVASTGFWLQASTGDAVFAGNTTIGNNLTVGQNASIGANLSVAGLITTGTLDANVVATTNMVQNAATNTITVQDSTPYPIVPFVNGTSNNPTTTGFLWPYFTRGFAVGGGAPITTTTTGSVTGSKITVNYSAYIYTPTNQEYNCVELWKSGASTYYKNVLTGATSDVVYGPDYGLANNFDQFLLVGSNGTIFQGNLGNIQQKISPSSTSTFYEGYLRSDYPNSDWYGWGNNGAYIVNVQNGVNTFNGNIANISSQVTGQPISNFQPMFNVYGINEMLASSNTNILLVGASGQIALQQGYGSVYQVGGYTTETSGTFNDLNSVTTSTAPGNYTNGATIYYAAVGASGTIIYNSRVYTSGNVSATTGWTQALSNTTVTLNSVACNYDISVSGSTNTPTNGNTWVAVGNQGTIVYTNSITGQGPWLVANSVPTTNNLQGVAYTNGTWVAVGDSGTIITSTDGSNWTGPISNPADGSVSTVGVRNLYTVTPGYVSKRWVIGGEEIVMTSNTTSPSGGYTRNYTGASSVNSNLTRLQFFGSWSNVADQSLPPTSQRVSNQQVVSGTYTDVDYTSGQTITYYLVLGNMAGNVPITTNSPSITVTEYKR